MQSLSRERIPLLTAVTTAANTGTSRAVHTAGRDELTFYFSSAGTTTGGTLVIEEADFDPDGPVYSGTWSQVGATINANDFTGTKQQAVHVSPNAYNAVRVRVATDITGGGTVSVVLRMQ